MTKRARMKGDAVMIVVRLPSDLRRKLKVIAAYENCSMNDKARTYIEKGIKKEEKIMENSEAN